MRCCDSSLVGSGHEAEILGLLKEKHFHVSLDVGAHCGLWTLALARVSDVVFAYEPHPDAFDDLTINTVMLDNVIRSRIACWCTNTEIVMNCYFHPSHSTLLDVHPLCGETGPIKSGLSVTAVRLDDDMQARDDMGVDFVKIDTEGSEVQVVQGATNIFRTRPEYMIECHSLDALEVMHKVLPDGRDMRYGSSWYWTNL